MSSETVIAIRCLRDGSEILEAAAQPDAHARLASAEPPEPGAVSVLGDDLAIVAERIGDVDAYALLDLSDELRTPRGWEASLGDPHESAALGTVAEFELQGGQFVQVTPGENINPGRGVRTDGARW